VNITIIGTGNVGSSLGGSLVRAGHTVTYVGRDAAKATAIAAATGGDTASLVDAATRAEVIVLAVPFAAVDGIAGEIASVAAGKVVVDATNPLRADYSGLATGDGPSGAELVAAKLPGASVVKAFNTLFASVMGNPGVHETTLDALYATDSAEAGSIVAAMAASMGFRPVQVGPLAAARELESLAWLNIRLQMLSGGAWQTSYALVAPPEAAIAA
jgi:predicted dinucleotide-binding enzyme